MMTESKPWQQPATFGEVRESATNWSLAGDARLLLLMEKISQEIISNQSEIQKRINDFQERLTSTAIQLANTENRFNHFANYKFTENRVYDQDVTKSSEVPPEEESKGREERLQEQMPQVRAAISLGLTICEATRTETSYESRPLPHLIGSQAFWEDASLGFYKAVDPNASHPVAAPTSEEPVMDALGPIPGSATSVTSSGDAPILNGHMDAPPTSGDIFGGSEEEDLFDQKDYRSSSEVESEPEEEKKDEARAPKSFSEELNAKLGQPSRSSEAKKSQAKPTAERKETPKKEEEEEEDEDEDDGDLFGRKSLFGAGGSLFADSKQEDSEDDDLFASKPLASAAKTSTPTNVKDEVDAKSAPSPEVISSHRKSSGPIPPLMESRPPEMGLFDSDDEDDIFRSAPLRSTAQAADLSESEDDDLFGTKTSFRPQSSQSGSKTTPATETPKPQATPSSQNDASSLRSGLAASEAASMFSDDDDDDLFAPKPKAFSKPEPKTPVKTEPKIEAKSAAAAPAPVAKIDPFAFSDEDDDDDDLFASRPAKVTPSKPAPTPAAAMAAAAAQQAAALVRQRRPPSSSDDDKDDDKYEEEIKQTEAKEKEKKSNIEVKNPSPVPNPPFSLDNDEDDEDDLFSPKKSAIPPPKKPNPAPTPVAKKSPFSLDNETEDDDDDLFSSKTTSKPFTVKPTPTPSVVKPTPVSATTALKPPFSLDNDDEDEDDLFSPKKPTKSPLKAKTPDTASPVVAVPPKKDLFGFGADSGTGPLLQGASPGSESSGWSDQEPLQVKATAPSPKPAVKIDGASGESTTDVKKEPKVALPPFGVRGPSLAEIKARVKNRKSSSSEEEPPPKTEAPTVDFSKPASATVLPNIVKNRARIQRPRRPPTRRLASASSTSDAPPPESSQSTPVQETKKELTPAQSKDQIDFDLTPDEEVVSNNAKSSKAEKEEKRKEEEEKKEQKQTKREEEKEAEKRKEEENTEKKNILQDRDTKLNASDSDDESLLNRPPPVVEKDEDDDLFTDLVIDKPRPSPAKEDATARISPKPVADDMDIFADLGATAQPVKLQDDKKEKSESPKPKRAASEDEDIFGSITGHIATKKEQRRGVATDDLFADDTDIFADVPAPKKVVAKKKTSPKVEQKKTKRKEPKEVAQEDIDDIFSSSPKSSGPKKVKAVSKNDADIFDDPLSM